MRDIERAIAAFKRLSSDSWIRDAIVSRLPEIRMAQDKHYQAVARSTPQRVDRGLAGYAIDSGALKQSLTRNWDFVDGQGLRGYTDIPYAPQQEQLLRQKATQGQARYSSLVMDDETAMNLVADAIADRIFEP